MVHPNCVSGHPAHHKIYEPLHQDSHVLNTCCPTVHIFTSQQNVLFFPPAVSNTLLLHQKTGQVLEQLEVRLKGLQVTSPASPSPTGYPGGDRAAGDPRDGGPRPGLRPRSLGDNHHSGPLPAGRFRSDRRGPTPTRRAKSAGISSPSPSRSRRPSTPFWSRCGLRCPS